MMHPPIPWDGAGGAVLGAVSLGTNKVIMEERRWGVD